MVVRLTVASPPPPPFFGGVGRVNLSSSSDHDCAVCVADVAQTIVPGALKSL